jgi:hypothetical protein
MDTKSKAIERVESREDQFGISLSLNQLRKLVEIRDDPRYSENAPDGYVFVTGKGVDCQQNLIDTIEIIPYSNEIDPLSFQLTDFKIFVNQGIIGDLIINLGSAHERSMNQPKILLDSSKDLCVPMPTGPGGNTHCCSGQPIPPKLINTLIRNINPSK